MRIDSQILAADNSGTNRVSDSQFAPSKGVPTPSSGPNDIVDLSSGQATVRQLMFQISQVPDVRANRVNSLKLQIQSGQYQSSNSQLAGAVFKQQLGANSNK